MFERVLIANRGEIACRIAQTARSMGVRTVAVYAEADAGARHTRLADEAWAIAPAAPEEAYLRGDLIVDIARRAGAEAIHPGYGFLSENADFAAACAAAGLVFIGPSPAAIRTMGEKDAAKRLMDEAGVPVVPGYDEDSRDLKVMATQARLLGFPVLIKAVAGGGGRGMRRVDRELDLGEAVAAARREAQAAFGDDRLILEKFVSRPRHVEVQIFGDTHGNAVHLFERDCSVQRRYQKIVEEAPSPAVTPALREALGEAAVRAARAVDYAGAGTVEFILDRGGAFHFIEMNARLQVEHPVTEAITGIDLVAWQLRIAAGEPLPLAQHEIGHAGHAIEARVCAENPARGFLPAAGPLVHFRPPTGPAAPGADPAPVRVDTGFASGDAVSPHYDSLLAKVVVHGASRAAAVRRLAWALAETELVGVPSNLGFLRALVRHPAFAAGDLDTGFVERHGAGLQPDPAPAPPLALALAALFVLLDRRRRARTDAAATADPHSPWAAADGWRLNDDARETIRFLDGDTPVAVAVRETGAGIELALPDGEVRAAGELAADGLRASIGGIAVRATVVRRDDDRGGTRLTVMTSDMTHDLDVESPLALAPAAEADDNRLTAPMPGKVTQVLCEDGARVARGAPLLVLEAMKVEHTIAAPADGRVERLRFAVGDQVAEGERLVDFAAAEGAA